MVESVLKFYSDFVLFSHRWGDWNGSEHLHARPSPEDVLQWSTAHVTRTFLSQSRRHLLSRDLWHPLLPVTDCGYLSNRAGYSAYRTRTCTLLDDDCRTCDRTIEGMVSAWMYWRKSQAFVIAFQSSLYKQPYNICNCFLNLSLFYEYEVYGLENIYRSFGFYWLVID